MKVLMLFLDGVGLGTPDSSVNPFFAVRLPAFESLCGGMIPSLDNPSLGNTDATLVPLDANLGVDGLPQSGTGQTALFTGENSARLIGKHFGPYPYSTLRPVIAEKNIFTQLLDQSLRVCFANAYPQKFFDYFDSRQTRLTVTTLSCHYARIPLRRFEELRAGVGISADITNAGWPRMGYDISPIPPAEAGRRLVRLTREFDFVLFEYWRTDKAGHSESMDEAIDALVPLDGMLEGILDSLDTRDTLLLITSDHGNIEDIATKVHTRNPVPAILYGAGHESAAESLRSKPDLTVVTPTIKRYLKETITASL